MTRCDMRLLGGACTPPSIARRSTHLATAWVLIRSNLYARKHVGDLRVKGGGEAGMRGCDTLPADEHRPSTVQHARWCPPPASTLRIIAQSAL